MKKTLMRFAAAALSLALLAPCVGATETQEKEGVTIRVGLASSSTHNSLGELVGANLWNNTGYGSGYRFGYYNENLQFVEVARTDETVEQVSVIKTQNTWCINGGRDTYSNSDNGGIAVGCYHILLEECADYETAAASAEAYSGFVAWINGNYQVRYGAYLSKEEAVAEVESMGQGEVVGTSSYGMNVVATGTDRILFQYDNGEGSVLGILPDVTGAEDVRTWFWDIKYRGGFTYQRIGGGNLTVVNVLDLEDYIKGVAPYEMGRSWPLEALKTQATCARTYALGRLNHHKSLGFDVCNSDNCQVYYGVGSKSTTWGPTEVSDQAVDETAGQVIWYKDELALTLYSSSHGGASEDIVNVWTWNKPGAYPYLCGVEDPYEAEVSSINAKSDWAVTYTKKELTKQLQSKGFGRNTSVDELELEYSELGNVIKLVVYWTNGQKNTFKPSDGSNSIRSVFGVDSIRFTVNGETANAAASSTASKSFSINGEGKHTALDGYFVISGDGTVAALDVSKDVYVITGDGDVDALLEQDVSAGTNQGGGTVTVSASTYKFEGGGWGHQMGMSQYGAYAMSQLGFDFEEICEFYYPGTEVGPYQP